MSNILTREEQRERPFPSNAIEALAYQWIIRQMSNGKFNTEKELAEEYARVYDRIKSALG